MRWTDFTYYHTFLDIPNLLEASIADYSLDIYIAENEPLALQSLLGQTMYNQLMANVVTDVNGLWQWDGIDAMWGNLINGEVVDASSVFSSGNTLYQWDGLRRFVGTWDSETNTSVNVKYSLLAYYVYFVWLQDKTSLTTQMGEFTPESISSGSKVRANTWNKYYEWGVKNPIPNKVSLSEYVWLKNKIDSDLFDSFRMNYDLQPINFWEC